MSQPDYFDRLRRMSAEQDSIYESTYHAYQRGDFAGVKNYKQYVEDNYPLSPLMPRFLFLNAIAVAKTEGQPAFIKELQDMVARYPESELATMAKDMLALMGQGAETQEGDLTALQTKRKVQTAEITEDSVALSFNIERHTTSLVVLIMPQDEQLMNQLLYEIALYNFSQFMIRDFDIEQFPIYDKEHSALQISGFEKMDDAEWYYNLLKKNSEMQTLFTEKGVEIICIDDGSSDGSGTIRVRYAEGQRSL